MLMTSVAVAYFSSVLTTNFAKSPPISAINSIDDVVRSQNPPLKVILEQNSWIKGAIPYLPSLTQLENEDRIVYRDFVSMKGHHCAL